MTTMAEVEAGYECRIYEWSRGDKNNNVVSDGQTVNRRCFIIRRRHYGDNLDAYLHLVEFARRYFPEVKDEDITPGKVMNSGYMDGHAVISFMVNVDWPLPAKDSKFRYLTGFIDFGY